MEQAKPMGAGGIVHGRKVEVLIVRRLATFILAMTLMAVACSCTSLVGATEASQSSPGLHALQFHAKTLDGADFSGQSLSGKPAVLWFWAPWCPTCQAEAPTVAQAARTHPAVTFLGVAARDQVPAMKQFVAKYQMAGFTHLADVDGSVWRHFDIFQQPAFAFIASNGSAQIVRNTLSPQDLDDQLTALAKT